MVFIWGSYRRQRSLGHENAMCDRCGVERAIDFHQIWRTAHACFFPLFAFDQAILSRCSRCHREGVCYYPHPPPKLPLFDRLGYVLPVGSLVAILVYLLFLAVTFDAKTLHATTPGPGTDLRRRLESVSFVHESRGASELAIENAIKRVIKAKYENVGDVKVAAAVTDDSTEGGSRKRAVVILQLWNLRGARDDIRESFLDDVHDALADVLRADDVAVVGIRGRLLYGAMASGPVGAPWAKKKIAADVTRDLDDAIAER
jgi:hypothetical protein